MPSPSCFPLGKDPVPFNSRLGESQGLSGQVLNISSTLRFDPHTVQGEVSLTDNNTSLNKNLCATKNSERTHSKYPNIIQWRSTANNYQQQIIHKF